MEITQSFKQATIAMVVVFIAACAENPLDIPVSKTEVYGVENPDYEIIRSLGWQTENIVEEEELYVVEGDVLLYKSYIDSLKIMPATRQVGYADDGRTISGGRENGIRVKITSHNIPDAAWRQAVREAVEIWNNVENCPVYFYKIENEILPHNVKVDMDNTPAIADATPPYNGKPGSLIRINSNIDWYNTTHEQKVNILVHEFGHILGLGHTDLANTDYSLSHIEGTPDWSAGQRDQNSVMRHNTAGEERGDVSSWNGFSAGDLAAIQAMYGTPIWSQEITGPLTAYASVPTTYSLNIGTNLTQLNIKWYVNDVLRQTGSSRTFSLVSPPQATLILRAVVNYAGVNYEASKRISVADFTINGPGSTTLNTDVTYTVVPDVLPAGVTFIGWTVSPNTYTTTNGLANRSLKVKFTGTTATVYNITANFRLPNGSNYTTSKGVTVTPPPTPPAPVISTSGYILDDREASALGKSGQKVYWVQPYGSFLTVMVSKPVSYATYEWRASYTPPYSATGSYINITLPSYTMLFPVECRASSTSGSTGWSTVWIYSSTTAPSENPYQYLRAVEEAKSKYGDSALL